MKTFPEKNCTTDFTALSFQLEVCAQSCMNDETWQKFVNDYLATNADYEVIT